jgi:hypothetical protein
MNEEDLTADFEELARAGVEPPPDQQIVEELSDPLI